MLPEMCAHPWLAVSANNCVGHAQQFSVARRRATCVFHMARRLCPSCTENTRRYCRNKHRQTLMLKSTAPASHTSYSNAAHANTADQTCALFISTIPQHVQQVHMATGVPAVGLHSSQLHITWLQGVPNLFEHELSPPKHASPITVT